MFELQLARYLNRSYWEERNERQTSRDRSSAPASAPVQREELNNYSDQVCCRGSGESIYMYLPPMLSQTQTFNRAAIKHW